MKLRNRLMMLGLAALAGYIASRPDIRRYLSQSIEEHAEAVQDALESGREAADLKEKELEDEVKAAQSKKQTKEK